MTLYGFAHRFAAPVILAVGRVQVKGRENVPDGSMVLCSNHCSNIDPVILASACPKQLHYMAKEELFRVPLLAPLIVKLGAFPVRRGAGDLRAMRMAARILKRKKVLGMFPEGHRNRKKSGLLPFHSGVLRIAYQANVPVLPTVIVWGKGIWPFRRLRIVFGRPQPVSAFGMEGTKPETIRTSCKNLRETMLRMLEENRL